MIKCCSCIVAAYVSEACKHVRYETKLRVHAGASGDRRSACAADPYSKQIAHSSAAVPFHSCVVYMIMPITQGTSVAKLRAKRQRDRLVASQKPKDWQVWCNIIVVEL